jgi:AAA domain-containing protein
MSREHEAFQEVTDTNQSDDRSVVIKSMNQYTTTPIRWLEEGRIALGKLTLIAGDPGLGKSFITLDMAARVSRGELPRRAQISGDGSHEPANNAKPYAGHLVDCGQVVLLNAEDDAGDTIKPRLETMGADLDRVHLFEGVVQPMGRCVNLTQLDTDVQLLANSLKKIEHLKLIIIDPISAYMGKTDSHNNADVRSVLAQLARLAQWTGAAVVCVTHLNKDAGGKRAIYRAMGSLAFTAAARAVHLVSKHPDDASKRVVAPVKNNLSEESSPRVYRIDEGRVVWIDEDIQWDADSIEQAFDGGRATPSAMEEAKRFLEEALGEGPALATKLREDAEGNGISFGTLKRAKRALAIESYRRGDDWYWMIRTDESDEPRDSMPIHPEPDELIDPDEEADEAELRELARLHGYEDNSYV